VGQWHDRIVFPVYTTSDALHVEDAFGRRDIATATKLKGRIAMISPTEFWNLSAPSPGWAPFSLAHYAIVDGALELGETVSLGTKASIPLDMICLTSGKILAAWYQAENFSSVGVNIGFAYRNSLGAWVTLPNTFLSPCTATAKGCLVQHPADGSVWFFHTADGASTVRAIRLIESGDAVAVDWVDNAFIPYVAGNPVTPEGEWPWVTAEADPATNSIILAYQNSTFKYFRTTAPVVKGANIAVVRIKADKTKSLLYVTNSWVERVRQFALIVRNGGITLAYPEIDETTLKFNRLVRFKNGATEYLGTLAGGMDENEDDVRICHSRDWIIAGMVNGAVHFWEI